MNRAVLLAAGRIGLAMFVASLALADTQLATEQRQKNIDSFEYVWRTIRDKHWQANPAGLNWQAVHDELRPSIEKASTMDAARAVLNDMLGRLHQTHFAIVPSDLYSDLNGSSAKGEITTGIDVRVIGADVLVTSVEPGFSAARQGVRPGWRILKIGSLDLAPVIEKLNEAYAKSTLRELALRRAVLSRLAGTAGESTPVEFLDGSDRRVSKSLAQGTPRGELSQFGFLYPMHVWFESAKLGNNDIGYVSFNIFLDPAHVMARFADAVESCKTCRGFIIDLRGNPGGIGAMAMGMAGWFLDQPDQRLGTLTMRDTTLKFVVNPRVYTFSGPLAILVDGASASTSEILAG
ncbi:MAG TPA: S41 family peptidase, partial [Bryobacteraceae bacterium]|nr:S41 family peptidase [Bryobacteraceae bacterium]